MNDDLVLTQDSIIEIFSSEKYAAIHELLTKSGSIPLIQDVHELEKIVIAREKKQSTGMGNGVAIAHGKTPKASRTFVLLGISHKGVQYDSFDGKPVHLLFLVLSNPDRQEEYIDTLSIIARVAGNIEAREALRNAHSPKEVLRLFADAMDGTLDDARLYA